MSKKTPKSRYLILTGGVLLVISITFTAWIQLSVNQNKSQESRVILQDDIYVRIPWRSGAIDLDPHWRTTFADLGLKNLESLKQLPPALATLDPWENSLNRVSNIFLISGDLTYGWSITVGHGFVQVRLGKTIYLYHDTIGLERLLLKQGIAHGWLTDMQRIFPDRDFTDLKPTDITRR